MSLILRNLNFELILHYFQAVRTNLSIDTFSDHRIWIRIAYPNREYLVNRYLYKIIYRSIHFIIPIIYFINTTVHMPGQVFSGLRRIWEACIEIRAADSYY